MPRNKISIIATATLMLIVTFFSLQNLVEAEESVAFEMFDSCRNVTFKVTNNRNVAIEIKKIKYYNASKGNWKTEDVGGANARCERGASCTVGGSNLNFRGEDLADAEGDRLTKIVFVYKDVNSNTTHESQQFTPSDPVCRVEKVYGHGQRWTISGNSDAGNQNSSSGLGDACKNVSFLVKNNTENSVIFITKIKYFNRNSGKWKTENVSQVSCAWDETCTVGGQDDLADAKDDDITKISFVYDHYTNGSANRSANKESKIFNPTSPKCTEGKIFGTGQGWKIGNFLTPPPAVSTSNTTNSNNSTQTSSPAANANSRTQNTNSNIRKPTNTTVRTTGRQTEKLKRKGKKP